MTTNRVITQADQLLEHSLMMHDTKPPTANTSSSPKVTDISKDVDKFISRLPSNYSQLQPSPIVQIDNNLQKQPPKDSPTQMVFLSKYNFTNRPYRFQEAERQLAISKPQTVLRSKTQVENDRKLQAKMSLSMQRNSVLAEDSFDRSEVKFPTHNYYIQFDKKGSKKRKGLDSPLSKTVCLENKVRRLEEEVKNLKEYKGYSQTSTSFKKDGKMKLQQLLNSIIG